MSKAKPKINRVILDPKPKGEFKDVGGSQQDVWNMRLANLVVLTLPDHAAEGAATAAISGMADMKPADPIEGVLIGQIIAANEASLSAYRRAWAQPSEYFDARLKYLAVADKAARTVAVLSERLDRHRTQGQQQITVKHVTVNADQAVVAEMVVTGASGGNSLASARLISTEPDRSFRMPDTAKPEPELVPVGRGKGPK
jgi:hypothetical protein